MLLDMLGAHTDMRGRRLATALYARARALRHRGRARSMARTLSAPHPQRRSLVPLVRAASLASLHS